MRLRRNFPCRTGTKTVYSQISILSTPTAQGLTEWIGDCRQLVRRCFAYRFCVLPNSLSASSKSSAYRRFKMTASNVANRCAEHSTLTEAKRNRTPLVFFSDQATASALSSWFLAQVSVHRHTSMRHVLCFSNAATTSVISSVPIPCVALCLLPNGSHPFQLNRKAL